MEEVVAAIPRASAGESASQARCLDFILKARRRHSRVLSPDQHGSEKQSCGNAWNPRYQQGTAGKLHLVEVQNAPSPADAFKGRGTMFVAAIYQWPGTVLGTYLITKSQSS